MVMNRIRQQAADIFFPQGNACHLCGRYPPQPGLLCDGCMDALQKLRYGRLRMAASAPHPQLTVCLAAWPHRAQARELVHLLKYGSDCFAAGLLGEGMAAVLAASPLRPERIDAVMPVPLHASRLRQRGYNQAFLLAQAVCSHTQLSLLDGVLVRVHATDTQIRRGRVERLLAMQHAFAVTDAQAVRGGHILLVDDVLTTGATAMSCAQALMAAGAEGVSLLTACRS